MIDNKTNCISEPSIHDSIHIQNDFNFKKDIFPEYKSNQGNQGYSGNQKNVFQGQRLDMENRHKQQRT